MSAATYFTYNTPVGTLTIASDGSALTHVVFGKSELAGMKKPSELTNKASTQLQEYFAGKRQVFTLPYALHGTSFQQDVWQALTTIPYGETRSYTDIACLIGNASAGRSVGSALNKNPLSIIVPSHRVVGAKESRDKFKRAAAVGSSEAPTAKEFLLMLEEKGSRS